MRIPTAHVPPEVRFYGWGGTWSKVSKGGTLLEIAGYAKWRFYRFRASRAPEDPKRRGRPNLVYYRGPTDELAHGEPFPHDLREMFQRKEEA